MFTKHQLLYHIMLICKWLLSVIFSIIYFVHHVLPFYIFILQEFRAAHGDFIARSSTCARGLPRSLSDHGSGTSSLAPRPVLGDCHDHSPTTAWGLRVSTTCDWQLAYSWDIFSPLDLAIRPYLTFQQARGLHRYDAPTGASRIACMTIGFST